MSIISFNSDKEKFEKLLTDATISENNFDLLIEDLVFQAPLGAMQLGQPPFLIRTSVPEKDECSSNVSRCSYAPNSIKHKIPLQRCNVEGQQVFYASIPGGMTNFNDGAQPSLLETVMQKIIDDPTFNLRDVAASRWRINRQPVFWFLPHFKGSIGNNKNFKFLFNHFDKFLKSSDEANGNYQNFTEKINYLSDLFCRNSNRNQTYKVTAAYYNKVMSLFKPFDSCYDALIYPSANTAGEGMNIVLTKEYIDSKSIYCDLVVLYKIIRNPNDFKKISFLPYAQATPYEDGSLDYKPIDINMLN